MTIDNAFLLAAVRDDRMINVLFLGHRNAERSLMAEALLNYAGGGRFWAYSAGCQPATEAEPLAIVTLRAAGIPCGGLRPKGWTRFTGRAAPRMDLVVVLSPCIHPETMPRFAGNPAVASWSVDDAMPLRGSREDQRAALARILRRLEVNVLRLAGPVLTGRVTFADPLAARSRAA